MGKAVGWRSWRTGPTLTGPAGRASTRTRCTTSASTSPAGSAPSCPRPRCALRKNPGMPTLTHARGKIRYTHRKYTHKHTHTYSPTYTHAHTSAYRHIHTRIFTCVWYTHTHTHTHTHTCILQRCQTHCNGRPSRHVLSHSYTCPFVEKFSIDIETYYKPDTGIKEDVFNLSSSDKRERTVGTDDPDHQLRGRKDPMKQHVSICLLTDLYICTGIFERTTCISILRIV